MGVSVGYEADIGNGWGVCGGVEEERSDGVVEGGVKRGWGGEGVCGGEFGELAVEGAEGG